jgi:hypothetical protein
MRVTQGIFQLLAVQATLIERVTAAAVWQRQHRSDPDVLFRHRVGSAPGRMRQRGPSQHQVSAHPVDLERGT